VPVKAKPSISSFFEEERKDTGESDETLINLHLGENQTYMQCPPIETKKVYEPPKQEIVDPHKT